MYRAAEVNDAEHEDFYALPVGDGFGHHGIVQMQRAALDDLATAVSEKVPGSLQTLWKTAPRTRAMRAARRCARRLPISKDHSQRGVPP